MKLAIGREILLPHSLAAKPADRETIAVNPRNLGERSLLLGNHWLSPAVTVDGNSGMFSKHRRGPQVFALTHSQASYATVSGQ